MKFHKDVRPSVAFELVIDFGGQRRQLGLRA